MKKTKARRSSKRKGDRASPARRIRLAALDRARRQFAVCVEFQACGCRDMDSFLFLVVGRHSDGSGTELREGGIRDHQWDCKTLPEARGLAKKLTAVLKATRSFYVVKTFDYRGDVPRLISHTRRVPK